MSDREAWVWDKRGVNGWHGLDLWWRKVVSWVKRIVCIVWSWVHSILCLLQVEAYVDQSAILGLLRPKTEATEGGRVTWNGFIYNIWLWELTGFFSYHLYLCNNKTLYFLLVLSQPSKSSLSHFFSSVIIKIMMTLYLICCGIQYNIHFLSSLLWYGRICESKSLRLK